MQSTPINAQAAEIRAVEPPRVRHLLIYYFLQGLGLSIFFVVANSLFLSSFVAADLPGAYLVSAAVLFLLGRMYDMVAKRVSSRGRTPLLIFMSVTVFVLFAGTQLWANTWVPFALFVWYRVLYTFSDLEFWGLSNLFFETREAKSLFGFINMRDIPARVVGFFSVGLLVQVVDIPGLLVIAGIAFFVNFFVARQLLDPRYAKDPQAAETGKKNISFLRFDGKALLLLLGMLAITGITIFTIVNFVFLSLAEDRVHRAAELATYLGVVFGIANLLIVAGKTIATNKITEKIGARASMLALPVFLILTAALLLVRGSGMEEKYLTFYVILLAGGRVLNEVLFTPVFVSLAQPLPDHVRQRSYIFIKTIAEPVGLALAAVVIYYAIRRLPLPNLDNATYIVPALAVVMILLILVTFQSYITAFKKAMADKTLVTRAIDSFNSFSQAIIKEKLDSPEPEDVIYAYKICSEANTHFFEMQPARLLRHESAEVRLYALKQMSVDTPFSDTDILIHLSANDPSIQVRQAAIEHLGARYKDSFADDYNALLENTDLKLREAALRGLMESGNPEIIMIAGQKLNELIASPLPELNSMAASIIGDIKLNSHYKHLQHYFEHSDARVRKAAIIAAGKLAQPQLMPLLFNLFEDGTQLEDVVTALAAYGNTAVAYLLDHKEIIERYPGQVLALCRKLDDKTAARLIAAHLLPLAENALLDECLQALADLDVSRVDADRGVLELKLVNAGSFIYTCLYYIDTLEADATILRQALDAEIKNTRRRLLLLLSLMYDKKEFARVIRVADQPGNNKGQLTGMLEGILDANHRKRFLPIFELEDYTALNEYLKQFYPGAIKEDASEAILVGAKKSRFRLWTQAAALYTYLLFLSDEVLKRYNDHNEEMISEMVRLALSRKPFVLRMIGDDSSGSFSTDEADPLLKIERIMVLKSIPIFEQFPQDMLAAISGIMTEQRFKTNELVYKEGEPGDYIFIIYYGTVSMYNGVQEIMQQGGKEVFVKIATEDQKLASARAQNDTLLFKIGKEDIEALSDQQPVMVNHMLRLFTTL